ncbi:MAG: DUF4258 domain-containing protein [Hormoscilla sp. GM102CHS1]|nr:DUF4258 domain-containing protein [Hormoscilla sp. GM102CHS1]
MADRSSITGTCTEFIPAEQSLIRNISVQELREAIANGEVIEYYPDDKYGPSCLILGFTLGNRPLHIQCSYPFRPLLKIILIYEPNHNLWINFQIRRTHHHEN